MTAAGARPLVVVGSGLAGLYATIAAAGRGLDVTLVTKDRLQDSNTWCAAGGIAAVGPAGLRAPGDSVDSHVADTLRAGAFAGDEAAVRTLCAEAWGHLERVIEHGVDFDRDHANPERYALGLEGAHEFPRILHHHGDATGRGLASALIEVVRGLAAEGRARVLEHAFVTDLVVSGGRVSGVQIQYDGGANPSEPGANPGELRGDVLLATGGIGRLYPHTTNPAGATGDGAALALRAARALGVDFDLVDAEFVQFHPTLWEPAGGKPFMITEAVRGEGARLVNALGQRFMPQVHPEAELAPRDVVARAIYAERAATGIVFLDARHLAESEEAEHRLAERFPTVTAALAEHGLSLAHDQIPVAPAQHYWMGGIATDLDGRTSLPGLWAAGEVASTGVHGANRLASNSLLEALVFGWRAIAGLDAPFSGDATASSAGPVARGVAPGAPVGSIAAPEGLHRAGGGIPGEARADVVPGHRPTWEDLHQITGAHLAVEREAAGLIRAVAALSGMVDALLAERDAVAVAGTGRPWPRDRHELLGATQVAHRIAVAALRREHSIGAHYRLDTVSTTPEPAEATPADLSPSTRAATRRSTVPTPKEEATRV